MLTREDSLLLHALQNVSLILLSFAWLPIDTLVLCAAFLLRLCLRKQRASYPSEGQEKCSVNHLTVLVTGVGMTKGLSLARLFHRMGHRVIGADFGSYGCGRGSAALAAFYSLQKPCGQHGSSRYMEDLVSIIKLNKVDIWISCSGVASAIEDAKAKEIVETMTACKAIQFNVAQTSILHEKNSFIDYTRSLGLVVPETYTITDGEAAERTFLNSPKGKRYIMKCVGLDDSTRGDMTLLPFPSHNNTREHLAKMHISHQNPWIIQEYIKGKEYCTHSLVIHGQVTAFVACPSSELLMHYEALPSTSPLSLAMLQFTKTFAASGGPNFTGHLSFDFMVEDVDCTTVQEVVLFPIECNPRAHTAVALFNRTPALVSAYLSLLQPSPTSLAKQPVVAPIDPGKYYWMGHDLVNSVMLPIFHAATKRGTWTSVGTGIHRFGEHLFEWQDGTFEIWDPLPWWWLYHVYWPMEFLNALVRCRKWSRINVSTTKMFMC